MPEARQRKQRTRLSPEARQAMILGAAIEFFAEHGFAAQTRELAARLDISESLIYRYFPTKEALIQRVYQQVTESRWDDEWTALLQDRGHALRERLLDFYQRYLDAIDDAIWIRIVMYASLEGLDMTRQYIAGHVEKVMAIIARESKAGFHLEDDVDPDLVWHLQSTLVYYLVRKHIHRTSVNPDRDAMVATAVDAYLDSLRARPQG